MKKIFIFLILFCLVFPVIISAETTKIENPLEYDSFDKLVKAVIGYFFWLAIALTPLLVIVGAFYLMTAAGDPEKITKGKNIILWTCIGFAVILFSWGIIALIQGVLGVK